MAAVHVIGAGLAGLACAVRLITAGRAVVVYEATDHAGGRCRSFFDPVIGRLIDNGNHLLFGANTATFAYLDAVGARDVLLAPPHAVFPFVDLATGRRWTVRPNAGRIPWWITVPSRRIPHTRTRDYLAALRLRRAGPDDTVAACLDADGAMFRCFWQPLAVAVLNASAEEGAARLLWPVVAETFLKGEAASRPYVARSGLSPALVEPAVNFLRKQGCPVHLTCRLRGLAFDGNRVTRLDFGRGGMELGPQDAVVLTIPPASAAALLPDIRVPEGSRAIVNAHFRLPESRRLPEGSPLLGLIGGTSHWLFLRDDVVSVTVSAANGLAETPSETIADVIWPEVARALDLEGPAIPPYRIVKERRATFAQTPEALVRRPGPRTSYANLLLAGDWTDTGLPATIESAVRSGQAAAELILSGASGRGPERRG